MAAILDGEWLIPPRGISLTLQQNGPNVTGTLRDKDFVCELTGHFDGVKVALQWKSGWSWTNRQESGAGELHLSGDYNSLNGSFLLFGSPGQWAFARAHPFPKPQPAPPPNPAPHLPHPHGGHVPNFPPPQEPFRDHFFRDQLEQGFENHGDMGAQANAEAHKKRQSENP